MATTQNDPGTTTPQPEAKPNENATSEAAEDPATAAGEPSGAVMFASEGTNDDSDPGEEAKAVFEKMRVEESEDRIKEQYPDEGGEEAIPSDSEGEEEAVQEEGGEGEPEPAQAEDAQVSGPSLGVQAAVGAGLFSQAIAESLDKSGDLTQAVVERTRELLAQQPAQSSEAAPEPVAKLVYPELSVEDGSSEQEVERDRKLKAMFDAQQSQIDGFQDQAREDQAIADTRQRETEFYSYIDRCGEEWSSVFGKDPRNSENGSKERVALENMYAHAQRQLAGYRALGQTPPSSDQLYKEARDALNAGRSGEISTTRQVAKLKKSQGRITSRPSSRKSKPSEAEQHRRDIEEIRQGMRKKGIGNV